MGWLKIEELRDRTKEALVDQFDIGSSMIKVLGNGSMPLDVLEEQIQEYPTEVGGKNPEFISPSRIRKEI